MLHVYTFYTEDKYSKESNNSSKNKFLPLHLGNIFVISEEKLMKKIKITNLRIICNILLIIKTKLWHLVYVFKQLPRV
jgi:hypothetical protein